MSIGLRHLLVLLVLLTVAGCSTGVRPLPPPPGTEADIADAERLGRIMVMHDVAAARATDEMIRIGAAPSTAAGVLGWITVPDPNGVVVRFVGQANGAYVALYDVAFSPQGEPSATRLTPPAPLPAEQAASFRARQTAIDSATLDCSDRYNTVVFRDPMAPGDDWLVYLLPASTVPGRVMVSRQLRIQVSEDGTRVLAQRPLAKNCMSLERAAIPAGATPIAMWVTNLATPTPNESHVYLSLLEGVPFVVGTQLGSWVVQDGRIRYRGASK